MSSEDPNAPQASVHHDVVLPIVIPDFEYPIGPAKLEFGHVAIFIYSPSADFSHLLEFGLYHPKIRGERAVRAEPVAPPKFTSDGTLIRDSLRDVLRAISRMEGRLPLWGNIYELPPGGARRAVELAERWAESPPEYQPEYCSCLYFTVALLLALGDITAVPSSPLIKLWQGSRDRPRFKYLYRPDELTLSPSLRDARDPPCD
jgi:hypothetical protein